MSNGFLKKGQNQMKEYMRRLERVQNLTNEHELYTLQYNRIQKQLRNLKVKDGDGKLVWKASLRIEDEDEYENEYEFVLFHHPKYKRVTLTRDKLKYVENRLKHDRQFLKHLESRIRKNKY
jgi:hypothetical protein